MAEINGLATARGSLRMGLGMLLSGSLLSCQLGHDTETPRGNPSSESSTVARQEAAAPTLPPESAPPLVRDDIKVGELLVDDFSRCDASLENRLEGFWYPFTDQNQPGEKACNHGSLSSELRVALGGSPPSPCHLEWRATLKSQHWFAFAGMGVSLGETSLQRYSKLYMITRGDGMTYRVKFPMQEQQVRARQGACGNDDWNAFGANFICGNGTSRWVAVRVELSQLQRDPGWRTRGLAPQPPLNLSDVKALEFQTVGSSGQSFQCDVGLVKFMP